VSCQLLSLLLLLTLRRWLGEAGETAPLEGFPERAGVLRRQLEARKLFRVGIAAALALAPPASKQEKKSTPGRGGGRVAVVTGGNRGLGRALVQRIVWAAEFETVVFSSRVPCHIDGAVCVLCGDFADPNCVRDFAANVLRQFGRVDALVNNAGEMATRDLSFGETTAEEMMRSYAVNTVAPVVLAQCFLPGMQQRGWGAVVNVSSGQGAMNEMGPLRLAYRCCKVRYSIFDFCFSYFSSGGAELRDAGGGGRGGAGSASERSVSRVRAHGHDGAPVARGHGGARAGGGAHCVAAGGGGAQRRLLAPRRGHLLVIDTVACAEAVLASLM
jgi:hypothetical protein